MTEDQASNINTKTTSFRQKFKANLRYIFGGIIFFLGGIFMFVPFIPLGYAFLGIGAFLLSPAVPALRKLLRWIEQKDESNRIKKMENKTEEFIDRTQDKL